jgi:hypothetical protein
MSEIRRLTIGPCSRITSYHQTLPSRGWGLDFIGEIHSSSSKGHRFMLVANEYFTKWTKVVALKNMTHKKVIEFITDHIIHRLRIP